MPDSPAPVLGLRERKKAKTRAAIREHAMRLFREQGYAETTVDQIAEAAEVSPSTFFRYFPTKEDVVLNDDLDPVLVETFRRQPPELTPIQAVRGAMREVFRSMSPEARDRDRARYRLVREVPELQVALLEEYRRLVRMLAGLVAERLGRDPAELRVRVFAGALIGVVLAMMEVDWDNQDSTDMADLSNLLDEAFAMLEAGLPL